MLRIHILFFLSGIAGLIYQVIWVRQFGNIFGNDIFSAALVTSVFMCGLGIGGLLTGRWADRRYARDPEAMLRTYARFELGIGVFGLAIAFGLVALAPLSAVATGYVQDQHGWHTLSGASWAIRYLVATLMLVPPTFLMGGTLTLLIRYSIRSDLSLVGWRVGALYGVNTAGAALGAFVVDFALVKLFGLLATQSIAALLNFGVGLWALRLASARTAARPAPAAPAVQEPEPMPSSSSRFGLAHRRLLLSALALSVSGFAAMGMEIVWFRFLTGLLGAYRATFSLLLTVILVGIWLGSMVGGIAHRRLGHGALLYIAAQGAFAACSLLMLMRFAFDPAPYDQAFAGASPSGRVLVQTWAILVPVLSLVSVPAFLMGFSFPLANAHAQQAEASVGSRAGVLYLANTAGAVAGSLCAGFLFLPGIGIQSSVTVFCGCAVAAALPLALSLGPAPSPSDRARSRRWLRPALGGLGLVAVIGALVLLVGWWQRPAGYVTSTLYRPNSAGEQVLAVSEGINEIIVVTRLADGSRRLYTNGHSMSTTAYGAQRYMRAFAHLPLLLMDEPRRALVICFGVGNTLHAASLHRSLRQLEVVDLSRHVLEHAPFFRRWNRDVLADPRVSVYINDGRQHLRMRPIEHYDLITLEPPPISQAGVASLYSTDFYRLARSRLRRGGYLTQWLPAYQVSGASSLAIVRAFVEVFPDAVLLSGYRAELILMGRRGPPLTVDPLLLKRRLQARSAVLEDLRRCDLGSPTEILGTYAASGPTLARATRDVAAVSDDFPIMEYDSALFHRTVIPASLFELDKHALKRWCPRCFERAGEASAAPDLEAYAAYMQGLYANRDFLTKGSQAVSNSTVWVDADRPSRLRAYSRSAYLRRMFSPP